MRIKHLTVLIVIASLLLSACGGAAEDKLVLNIGWLGMPDSLNPGMGQSAEAYVIYDLVYSSLYAYKTDATFALDAAESVTSAVSNRMWTYKIRPGATFHDGKPVTAADVVFSYRLYASHSDEFPIMPGYLTSIEDVRALGTDEVVIELKQAIPNLESQLFGLYILPKHVWATVEDPVAFENLAMVGSGPFKLAEYVPGKLIRLAANESYYLGKPPMDEVVFKRYDKPAQLASALISGEIDLITEVPLEIVDQLKSTAGMSVVSGAPQAPGLVDIIFNQIDEVDCPLLESVCSGHPALRDRVVRRALAHATNKQEIIDTVQGGLAVPGLTLIPNGLPDFYNDQLQDYAFDLRKANELLDDAGYLDTDGDGVRELPEGKRPLSFRLNWPDDAPENAAIAEILARDWAEVGVQTLNQALDSDTLIKRCCPEFDYDILLWSWSSDPDPSFLLGVPLGSEIASGFNETGYSNPTYDSLYDAQATELDLEARRAIVWKMQKILLEDAVYIIPYYSETVQAYRTDKFTNWPINAKTLSLQDPDAIMRLQPVK